MKYEFVPWTSYAERLLNTLNSTSKLCDLIIGDSDIAHDLCVERICAAGMLTQPFRA